MDNGNFKNFYVGAEGVKPAIDSHIWCPTEHLTSLELDVNDIVIFIKTSGASKQKVQKFYMPEDWILNELYIARVIKPIMNRKEYCQIKDLSFATPLWYDETVEGHSNPRVTKRKNNPIQGEWRWKRVFEFMPLYYYNNLRIRISDFFEVNSDFCEALKRTYGAGYSTEISKQVFEKTILDILKISNSR